MTPAIAIVMLLMLMATAGRSASPSPAPAPLRVCADPNNLPFTNQRGEGFENRIADLLARDLGTRVEYTWWAQRRGVIIAAAGPGKVKNAFQSIFIAAIIAWFAFRDAIKPLGWEKSAFARFWTDFHAWFVAIALGIAVVLTVWSFAVYIHRYRDLFSATPAERAK